MLNDRLVATLAPWIVDTPPFSLNAYYPVAYRNISRVSSCYLEPDTLQIPLLGYLLPTC